MTSAGGLFRWSKVSRDASPTANGHQPMCNLEVVCGGLISFGLTRKARNAPQVTAPSPVSLGLWADRGGWARGRTSGRGDGDNSFLDDGEDG
jgi:hypothetical protein